MAARIQMVLTNNREVLYGVTFEIEATCYGESTQVPVKVVGVQSTEKSRLAVGVQYSLEKIGREILGKSISWGGKSSKIEIAVEDIP